MHFQHPPPCPPTCSHCLAFDNHTRTICTQLPSPNSKWCGAHEELQAKLLKSYKRLTLALESFDDSLLPASAHVVRNGEDLVALKGWSAAARTKWTLARRVIVARAEHHAQFYAGGDLGHCLFVETVRAESARLERLLRALDRQAYSVTLARSSASWVLDMPSGPAFICEDVAGSSKATERGDGLLTPPPSPPATSQALPALGSAVGRGKKGRSNRKPSARPPVASSSPPADEFEKLFPAPPAAAAPPNIRDLLACLRGYLVPSADLPISVSPATWTSFVETVFRHVVLRIPALATLALSPPVSPPCTDLAQSPESGSGASSPATVQDFFDLLESRLTPAFAPDTAAPASAPGDREVELLWRGLKFARQTLTSGDGDASKDGEEDGLLGVGVLAEALDTVFRTSTPEGGLEQDDDDASVKVLGGRVWKSQSSVDWPRCGWDLFYQLVACPGCTLIATHSLKTWTTNRRLAVLGRYPAWLAQSEAPAERIFRLSGIVLCTSNSCTTGKKVRRVEQKEKGSQRKKTVYIEEMERGWMYLKLPLDDARSARVLDHLASDPQRFSVLARRTASNEVTHFPREPKEACGSVRSCTCCDDGDLWLSRVRSGLSPVERKSARWTTTSFFPRATILSSMLKSSSPESRFHNAPYPDTYDALILDASPESSPTHDNWTSFADAVAEAILHAQGCASIGELLHREKDAAVERGEMRPGEWEELHACAVRGGAEEKGRKTVYVCEEGMTARRIFREEWKREEDGTLCRSMRSLNKLHERTK